MTQDTPTTPFIAGIGSRKTPQWALELAEAIGYRIATLGYLLTSGAAEGPDEAFERGVARYEAETSTIHREIWVPWKGFRIVDKPGYPKHFDSQHQFTQFPHQIAWSLRLLEQYGIVEDTDRLKPSIQKLFARNVFQILSDEQDITHKATMVIYWAPERNKVVFGGTAIAVHLARRLNIDCYNLAYETQKAAVLERLGMA